MNRKPNKPVPTPEQRTLLNRNMSATQRARLEAGIWETPDDGIHERNAKLSDDDRRRRAAQVEIENRRMMMELGL